MHTYTHVWMCRGGWEFRCVIVNVHTYMFMYASTSWCAISCAVRFIDAVITYVCAFHVRLCNECILSPSSADPVVPADV